LKWLWVLAAMTEARRANKPYRRQARPLADFIKPCLGETFARQGFASTEIVTRWTEIAGSEIAAHCEPIKIQWPRNEAAEEAATLVLRVEGPIAIEIQHSAGVIIERVNRFFGWQAIGRLALRQAPLARRGKKVPEAPPPEATARIAATLGCVQDMGLREALARLGAAVKRT
jgi:hypothetical protein